MSESNLDELSSLLSQPNIQLIDILTLGSLMSQIRAENAKLINYLQQDSVVIELAEWCFTTKYKENPRFIELSEISVSVILSTVSIIQYLLENEQFSAVLHDFLLSEDSKNSRLCGHFSRVIGAQIKWDIPSLFINYNDVQNLLLKRIDVLAICELITAIIFTNSDIINSEKIVEDLSILVDVESDLNAARLLISIFKIAISNTHLQYLFNNNSVLNHLINAAVKIDSPVIQSDIMSCLFQFQFQPSMVDDQRLIEKLTITENNINNLTISSIDFLQLPIDYLITLFFSKNATENFHKKVLSLLETLTVHEMIEVANIPNFVINLINTFGTNKWCPHCLQLAIFLINISDFCKPLRSKRWRTFIYGKFYHYIQILNHQYGGHVPSQFDDNSTDVSSDNEDSISDENKNLEFEEEEEFYDRNLCFQEDGVAHVENIDSSDGSIEYDIDV